MAVLSAWPARIAIAACATLAMSCASVSDPCAGVALAGEMEPPLAGSAEWPGDFVRALRESREGRAFLERMRLRAGGSVDIAVELLGNGLEREVASLTRMPVDKTDCRLASAARELRRSPARLETSDRFVVMALIDGWARRLVDLTTDARGPEPLAERARRIGSPEPETDAWLSFNFPVYYERAGRVLARLPL